MRVHGSGPSIHKCGKRQGQTPLKTPFSGIRRAHGLVPIIALFIETTNDTSA